jgi:prepilin-type processing-associated H-X9-DG protein
MDTSRRGFTLISLLVVVVAVAFLFALLMLAITRPSANRKARAEADRINCINNLKQVGLAFRIWAQDRQDKYPMAVPAESGGTKGFTTAADTYRHFQVMSNELSTPRILFCPTDTRTRATDFAQFNNQNLSYFIGLEANEDSISMFLAGDRNLTNDQPPVSGVLSLFPGQKLGWSNQMHNRRGNVLLSDGSVQSYSDWSATAALRTSGDATNVWHISLPE